MIVARGLLVVCVAGWAGSAFAQLENAQGPTPQDTSPQAHLVRGHALMDDLEFLDAAHEFSVVITHPDASEAEKQDARMHAGIAHRYMGHDVEARLLFVAVLKRAPTAQLPPGQHPPKLVSFFELVRDEVVTEEPPAPAAQPPPQPRPLPAPDPAPSPTATARGDGGGFNWLAISTSILSACSGVALAGCGTYTELVVYVTGVAGGGNASLQPVDFLGPSICCSGVGLGVLALGLSPFWYSSGDGQDDDGESP